MKLIRFGELKKEKPGILKSDGKRLDVSGFVSDYDENFFKEEGYKGLKKRATPKSNFCSVIYKIYQLGCPLGKALKINLLGIN